MTPSAFPDSVPPAAQAASSPTSPRWTTRVSLVLAVTVALATGGTLQAAEAVAYPAAPTGVRLAAVSRSYLTVTANRATGATGYRLYASTTKSNVYVANLAKARLSPTSKTPSVTLSGLTYTPATWYYRYATVSSAGKRYSEIKSTNLRPAPVTRVAARSSASVTKTAVSGTSVTWTTGAALGFRIAVATDPTMTKGRFTHTISSQARQYTPYGLRKGTRYYFRVQALNGSSGSSYSPTVSVVAATTEQSVRVMTYNVLATTAAGQVEGDGRLETWDKRKAGVVRLIRAANPDVIGLQEAAGWTTSVQGRGGVRQADDLAKLLKPAGSLPGYTLANTETPPSQAYYFRTARYILFKESVYAAVGNGGNFNIGAPNTRVRWAAYQVLKNRKTGAKFLFVSAHLSAVGGITGDRERQAETNRLIAQASSMAAAQRVPVVYVGDFNSHAGSNHPLDGPGVAFRAQHVSDALEVAQYRLNYPLNSANQNIHKPLASGRSIDHVYAPAGVALRSWRLGVELTNGRYRDVIPSDHNPLSVDVSFPY